MSDIYSAPESELTESNAGSQFGSLEQGIAGDYDLRLGSVLSEAWNNTKGAKTTILVAGIIMIVVTMVVSGVCQFVAGMMSSGAEAALFPAILSQVVITLLTTPLTAGMLIIGIRRASNASIRSSSVFDYFGMILPLFICMILVYVMLMIGFLLLIIPGIYLSVAYMFAIPLVVEKNLGPWEAMEASRKAVTKNWFTVFGIVFVTWLAVVISMIPLLIGLIWTLPWALIAFGTTYRIIFGVEQDTLAAE
ncbi:hypothetical protein HBA55_18795 [Pseudomaricurvus alkylphenolicus]|jgi:hypothetical protein|uniref:hypothetical protein n=1 Tax=Pseudomaricurvus alkylphenolicus TaxID=1306991 RepID=UPI00141FE11B|nr:hypothetical protein [Pseudomaricurvus alkylphenolicus]NIB41660.1 hypothetical protein [Pseudomaricurvus alkylphenolicus]